MKTNTTNKRKGYNGHKCWSYWNVSLWIANDEGMYRAVKDILRFKTRDDAAQYLKDHVLPERTPDGARFSVSAIRAAIRGDL